MKSLISFNRAISASLVILGLTVLFHVAVLIAIIFLDYAPVDYLWGGQLQTEEQLLQFELISLFISSLFFLLLLVRSHRIAAPRLMTVSKIAMWIMFMLFALNTVGNIMAKTDFEKYFAIITGLLAFLSLRIALEKNTELNA
jgi:hypothetical protein